MMTEQWRFHTCIANPQGGSNLTDHHNFASCKETELRNNGYIYISRCWTFCLSRINSEGIMTELMRTWPCASPRIGRGCISAWTWTRSSRRHKADPISQGGESWRTILQTSPRRWHSSTTPRTNPQRPPTVLATPSGPPGIPTPQPWLLAHSHLPASSPSTINPRNLQVPVNRTQLQSSSTNQASN